ncbi:MAG: PAS domain S-box protein, partial [Rubrobacter sp.]|nr:PAS domain S-box protein [Rubrobacter sp.]
LTVSLVRESSGEPRYFISVIEDITARRRVEEERSRLVTIVESTDDAIISKTIEGTITSWNRGAQRIYGYSAEEAIGKPISMLAPPDRRNEIPRILKRLRHGEAINHYETARITKDGRRLDISLTISPIRDSSGDITGASTIARNITERKRAEEALRQSELLYRTVIEQVAENIVLIDRETKRILQANTAFRRSLGYTAEELGQLTLYDFVAYAQEDVDRDVQLIQSQKQCFLGERIYRRKDGSLRNVEVSVGVVPYQGREVQCIVAHDVTDRRLVEEDLRRSLNVLLALYEAGRVLGSTLEFDEIGTRLLEIMQGVTDLTAAVIRTRDEEGRWRVWQALGPEPLLERVELSSAASSARRTALENEEPVCFRLQPGETEGGELGEEGFVALCLPFQVRERVSGILEAYGAENLVQDETREILGSLTSQAAAALENARLYQDLAEHEHQLQELVGQLLGAQEEERRRVAYEVHDGLAQMAASAHQRLQAYIRRHPPSSQKSEEDLDRIINLVQQTVQEARRIIGDLRPTTLDDFGLGAAVNKEIEHLRDEGWVVYYVQNLGDERLPVATETALFRIVQEALTNVRKHSEIGQLHVELSRDEGSARLRVRDWGQGFEPANLSTGGPGERVGISGMRERVAILGGEFKLWSRPGEGTLISVDVPLPTTETNDHSEGSDVRQ